MKFKEEKQSRSIKYKNTFLEIYEDDIILPNDKLSKRIVVDHIGAACVLPITKDNQVILVKQYRYAIGDTSLEIPAGKKDDKRDVGEQTAKRELEEETGYTCETLMKVTSIYSAIGYSNEYIDIYIAKDVTKSPNIHHKDDDEFIEVVLLPFEEAYQMVKDGIIQDSKTVVALLFARHVLS